MPFPLQERLQEILCFNKIIKRNNFTEIELYKQLIEFCEEYKNDPFFRLWLGKKIDIIRDLK
jgi:hypothetical protein